MDLGPSGPAWWYQAKTPGLVERKGVRPSAQVEQTRMENSSLEPHRRAGQGPRPSGPEQGLPSLASLGACWPPSRNNLLPVTLPPLKPSATGAGKVPA